MAENAGPQRSTKADMTFKKNIEACLAQNALFSSANFDQAPRRAVRPELADDIEDMWDNVPI